MRTHINRYGVQGKTYHYDATSGSDSNPGTIELPLQTITNLNAKNLKPGDRVLFKRGETWRGVCLEVPTSGSAGHMIYFGRYGSGNNPIIDPTLEYNDFTLFSGSVWSRSLTVDPIQVFEDGSRMTWHAGTDLTAGQYYWASSVLYVRCSDDGNPNTGHVIDHQATNVPPVISFNSKSFVHFDGIDIYRFNRGYSWDWAGVDEDCYASHHTVVTNCVASFGGLRGFSMGHTGNAGHYTVIISDCVANDNFCEGIWVGNGTDIRIIDCETYNNGKDFATKMSACGYVGSSGILAGICSVNVLIRNCYCHDGYTGAGIMVEYESGFARPSNTILDSNLIELDVDSDSGCGILDEGSGTLIKNNVIYRSNAGAGNCIMVDDNSANALIYHNTLILTVVDFIFNLGQSTGVTIKNNICYSTGSGNMYWMQSTCTGYNLNYNDYYGSSLTFRFSDGTYKYNLADWRTATTQEGQSIDTNPTFVTAVTDLHLQTSSPCKNTGATGLGVSLDYDGIPRDATPDMGAYEYV